MNKLIMSCILYIEGCVKGNGILMKKILTLFVVSFFCVTLISCGTKKDKYVELSLEEVNKLNNCILSYNYDEPTYDLVSILNSMRLSTYSDLESQSYSTFATSNFSDEAPYFICGYSNIYDKYTKENIDDVSWYKVENSKDIDVEYNDKTVCKILKVYVASIKDDVIYNNDINRDINLVYNLNYKINKTDNNIDLKEVARLDENDLQKDFLVWVYLSKNRQITDVTGYQYGHVFYEYNYELIESNSKRYLKEWIGYTDIETGVFKDILINEHGILYDFFKEMRMSDESLDVVRTNRKIDHYGLYEFDNFIEICLKYIQGEYDSE